MKIAIVLGTRPELIKLAPLIKELKNRKADYSIIRTGQHYSNNMWAQFMDELEVPFGSIHNLQVNNCSHGKMVGLMLQRLDPILIKDKPSLVIVQGDTDSALAVALAAAKLNIPVAHIEAGLRSFDKRMPEEHNRVIIDHISTYLFPPTTTQVDNLRDEGIKKTEVIGSIIVDTIKSISIPKNSIQEKYAFVTLHRQENVDCPRILRMMMEGIFKVAAELKLKIIFPVHPRTKEKLTSIGIDKAWGKMNKIDFIEPVSYKESIGYQKHAEVCITDSGGIVEESCVLGTPSVVVRITTDRPEAEVCGASITVGEITAINILNATKEALHFKIKDHPYGQDVSKKILEVLL